MTPAALFCTRCGAPLTGDARFCPACGQTVAAATAPPPRPPVYEPPPSAPPPYAHASSPYAAPLPLQKAGSSRLVCGLVGCGGLVLVMALIAAIIGGVMLMGGQPLSLPLATFQVPSSTLTPTPTWNVKLETPTALPLATFQVPSSTLTPTPPWNVKPGTSTATPVPTPDAAAIAREKTALAVHPTYKRYVHSAADFSVNIPDFWQSLAEDAKGRQIVLGSMSSQTNLQVGMSAAGQNLDEVVNNWVQSMKGRVVVPATRTAVGHYAARQMVVDVSDPYSRRIYLAAVSAPNFTFTLAVDGPAGDSDADIFFAVVLSSFRVPARCGDTVCPELLQRDAIVGTPVPAPSFVPVAPAATATPSAPTPVPGAITVYFTIQNGNPWGYVTDKQGTRYSTGAYPTISGIHTEPGDRIVLQTNAPGFVLLFDCGTTPEAYSPCDFTADSPANLPKEIRVNRGSVSAYLNISRGGNWGDPRPNFPGQRYPADPVLRIGLGR